MRKIKFVCTESAKDAIKYLTLVAKQMKKKNESNSITISIREDYGVAYTGGYTVEGEDEE